MTNLQKEIENLNNTIGSQFPPEMLDAFSQSIADLKMKSIGNRVLKKGMKIPQFSLESVRGGSLNLEGLPKECDKLILAFFRGSWCPYCNLELKFLQESIIKLEKKRVKLVAISPQQIEYSKALCEDKRLSFDILFDKDNVLASQFGISFQLQDFVIPYYKALGIDLKEYNGNEDSSLPIPAIFIVDKKHIINYTFVDPNYMNRIDIDELIDNL